MVVADFRDGNTKAYTKSLFQHDKGQRLKFEGIETPDGCEIQYSNSEYGGISIVEKLKDGSAAIPDGLLVNGDYVYAWIVSRKITPGSSSGGIEFHVDPDDPEGDHIIIDSYGKGTLPTEKAESLYLAVIPVIRRSAPVHTESQQSGEGSSMSYEVDGENFIFKT